MDDGIGTLPLAGIGCKQLVIALEREAGGRTTLCPSAPQLNSGRNHRFLPKLQLRLCYTLTRRTEGAQRTFAKLRDAESPANLSSLYNLIPSLKMTVEVSIFGETLAVWFRPRHHLTSAL